MPKEEFRWYIVQTYSGQEKYAKEDILHRSKTQGVEQNIQEIVVPIKIEQVIEEKTNIKKTIERILHPGYIYVKMKLDGEGKTWYVVRNTPKVTGILGSSGNLTQPSPVPQYEMDELFKNIGRPIEFSLSSWVDKLVEVLVEPFKGKKVLITDYNDDKKELYFEVDMFGSKESIPVKPNEIKVIK